MDINKILLCKIILLISIIGFSVKVNADPLSNYGASYKTIQPGDSMSYKITKVETKQSDNWLNASLWLQNDSTFYYNQAVGVIYKDTIVKKNVSNGFEHIYSEITLKGKGLPELTSHAIEEFPPSFIVSNKFPMQFGIPIFHFPALVNSSAIQYFMGELTVSRFCGVNGCPRELNYFNVSGSYDLIHFEFGYTTNFPTLTITYSLNWKTGWLEFVEYNNSGSKLRIEMIQNDILQPLINFTIMLAQISILPISVIVLVLTALSYRKYSKRVKEGKNNDSYLTYIKNELKPSNKKSRSKVNIENSLKTIETIIDESKLN